MCSSDLLILSCLCPAFQPPTTREGMQAILQHSRETYVHSQLRPVRVRSRTSSRASPYPVRSPRSIIISPERSQSNILKGRPFASPEDRSAPLSDVSINPNISACSVAPTVEMKPFTPFGVKIEGSKGKGKSATPGKGRATVRPRVTSSTRRSALGWKKRVSKANAATANKENAVTQDMSITYVDIVTRIDFY